MSFREKGEKYDCDDDFCRRLSENDKSLFDISIFRPNNDKLHRYGKSLENNNVVESLEIWNASELTYNVVDFTPILRFTETSHTLKRLLLLESQNVRLIEIFLQSLCKSSSMRQLILNNVIMPSNAIRQLLCSSNSLKKLSIINVTLEEELPDHAPSTENTSVEELEFEGSSSKLLSKIFENFGFTSVVRSLSIKGSILGQPVEANLSKSIEKFLSKSATIESLMLKYYEFEGSSFNAISSGISHCSSLRKLRFHWCQFDTKSSNMVLSTLQSSTMSVQSLELFGEVHFHIPVSEFVSDIVSSKPLNSKLVAINLSPLIKKMNLNLPLLLKPLEDESTLEHIDLGFLGNAGIAQDLINCIPRLRGLRGFTCQLIRENDTKRMVNAIRQNISFEDINFTSHFLQEDDKRLIRKYCGRNKSIRQCLSSIESIPSSFYPKVMEAANEIGNKCRVDILFAIQKNL